MKDYAGWYERISAPFRGRTAMAVINLLDRGLVAVIAAVYLAALAFLAINGDARAIRLAVVPALAFAFVTFLRVRIDEPRPYESFPIDPIIHKDTLGRSMPSRHIASAVVIACALAWLNAAGGIAAFCACVAVAFTRIVGGVHYPRDVFAAAAISAAFGIVGFLLIP